MEDLYEKKKEFVEVFSESLKIADPYIENVEFIKINKEDHVCVTMKNGYKYNINVEADSYWAIINDVTKVMMYK